MGGLSGLFGLRIGIAGRRETDLSFQFAPVPFLEAVEAGGTRRRAGIHVAVQGFVALAHLLPFAHRVAVAVAPGHQLLGAQLLQVLGVDLRQMHVAMWVAHDFDFWIVFIDFDFHLLAQVVVELQLGDADRHAVNLDASAQFLAAL